MAGELQTEGLSNALVILGAAGVVIPAFARVRINPIVGFLLVGVLVGPFGLGSLAAATLPTLADALLGIVAGAIVLAGVTLIQRLRGRPA